METETMTADALGPIPKIIPRPELVPIERMRPPFELYASIRKSSKYYAQGLDAHGKPKSFLVTSIIPRDSYAFRFNGNAYRREDINLFVKLGKELTRL